MSDADLPRLKRLPTVRAGFIPLIDCAPLVIAAAKGFDTAEGFRLQLVREVSWANIRDRIEFGAFDCAHMLSPMPLAGALGLTPARRPIFVPMVMNLGGSVITVSRRLAEEMGALHAGWANGPDAALALAAAVKHRKDGGAPPLFVGMVHPFSSHNYDLRSWLATGGVDPDEDVNLVVIPPPLLADSLKDNRIDGFCAGAPWGQVAVEAGMARIVATKSELWPRAPEKVLGVSAGWAERNTELLLALVRALVTAGRWLDAPDNHTEAARILSEPGHVGVPAELVARALDGRLVRARGEAATRDDDFMVFHAHHATFPWRSHALWLMAQMVRWGQAQAPFDLRAVADRVYRPDLYREAVAPLGFAVPAADYRSEGPEHDALDPAAPLGYLAGLAMRSGTVDLAEFAAFNR